MVSRRSRSARTRPVRHPFAVAPRTEFYAYLFRVIFRAARKNPSRVVLIADIHTFGDIRKRLRSKGGRGHFSLRIVRGEDGQAMAEYAVILGLIAATLILTYSTLGETTARLFESVVSQI